MVRGFFFMTAMNMLARLVMAFLLVMLIVTLLRKFSERSNLPVRNA